MVIGANILVGLVYRLLLCKNVTETGVVSRPVNLLTVIDEAVKMVGFTIWLLEISTILILTQPLYIYIGR